MNESIDRIIKRTQRYWYEDGLVEITLGSFFTLAGLFFLIQQQVTVGSPLLPLLLLGTVLFIVAGSWLVKNMLQSLKQRVTYPRTGYVKYRAEQNTGPNRRWILIFALVVLPVLTLLIPAFNQIVIFEGLLLAFVLAVVAYRSDVRRFYLLAAVSALLALLIALLLAGDSLQSAAFFGLFGLALLISGGVSLRGYLSQNPPLEQS